MKKFLRAALASVLIGGLVTVVDAGSASAAGEMAASVDPSVLGDRADTAAGSCWEIKQLRPTAQDGSYWLLTPAMVAPSQFYCDMTTDGGGWVLVGKGRENWTTDYVGQGSAAALQSPAPESTLSTTVQLPSRAVDDLLNTGRVDALVDGVRLRRALNPTGSAWQEVRMNFAGKKDRWNWSFGAETPLKSYSFDGVTTATASTSTTFGTDQAFNRVSNEFDVTHGYRQAFFFGSTVTGSTSPSSYLWSKTDGGGYAAPFTDVFVRPRVTTYDAGFRPIADGGTAAVASQKALRNAAIVSPWGLSNRTGTTSTEYSVEAQAFTQSGQTMFVGGNFSYVQKDAAGTGRVVQPYLAGFDVRTGELVSSFRPLLNEQVRALATLPDGSVVAAGEFTQANGAPATGIVALDPTTGATQKNFNLTMENRVTGVPLRIRSLDVVGPWLYVGGAVTHFAGGSRPSTPVYMRGLGRVSTVDGTPSTNWNPDFNGTVVSTDGSAGGDRIYAAGYFTASQGAPANKAASLQPVPGAALSSPAWSPVWSNATNYQQAVLEAGKRVWVGGSQHSVFSYDVSTFDRLSGNISKPAGGDTQAYAATDGMLLAGSHAHAFDYENAYTWPSLGTTWTRADAVKWFASWDATTGARIPDFTPNFSMRIGNGIWAIKTDTLGNVWAGGDIASVKTTSGVKFSGGFARFKLNDSTPPPTPGGFTLTGQTASSATFTWNTVSDSESPVRYEILRDDRPIALTTGNTGSLTVAKGGANRFFVRALDSASNASASSSVVALGPSGALPTASFTSTTKRSVVSVDASGSTSGAGNVTGYRWIFGDGTAATGAVVSHTYAAAGPYVVWLTVTTSNGSSSSVSTVVTAATPAQQSPTDPYGRAVYDQDPVVYYRLNEAAGTVAKDSGADALTGSYVGNLTRQVAGALAENPDAAVALDGVNLGFVVSPQVATAPSAFSVGTWFKTTSKTGGRLIGYSSANSGTSATTDRLLFAQNDGRVVFGVLDAAGVEQRATSTTAYNDGRWHYVVGTVEPAQGMKLYVDGAAVAGNGAATAARNYAGYWRVGSDRVWSGSSSKTLAGSLDEAVVFSQPLTAAQVATQYALGSSAPAPAANQPPTASFTASASQLTAAFDASASTDPDGQISSYSWKFGDGSTGLGRTVSHAYATSGTYTTVLTVTDDSGATATATRDVVATAAPADHVVIAKGAAWRWWYAAGGPAADWNAAGFDASGWSSGTAVLGFGTAVATNIDTFTTASSRPLAAYFSRQFQVDDASKVVRMTISSVADDGAVFYVNGTEVARSNMPAGLITSNTYASSARSTATANGSPVVVDVPVGLLTNGTNVVAAETHLNYRSTPNVSFDLQATLNY